MPILCCWFIQSRKNSSTFCCAGRLSKPGAWGLQQNRSMSSAVGKQILSRSLAFLVFLAATLGFGQSALDPDSSVRINQIQVIGTHNSYHAGLLPGIEKLLEKSNPGAFKSLDYRHAGLAEQLDHGIRQIELDVFADTEGGRYAHKSGQAALAQAGLPPDPDPYPDGVMLKPGFKVMHVQDLDYASNCQPFVACLSIVRTWSKTHPGHVPVFILIETKQDTPEEKFRWTTPEPFTSKTFDALDAEIRSVFPPDEMIVPDQVRGRHRTLDEAVRHGGWPTFGKARGKVIFLMDQKPVGPVYLEGHTALHGRVLFTNATPGDADAAFVEENDGSAETIAALVRKGYLVRTRADADTVQARSNDTARRDLALKSGAQIVSTDYPLFEPSRWTSYAVGLPEGAPARCNPVNAPKSCSDTALNPPAAAQRGYRGR